ncbi:hypothetical protein NIES2100_64470 [Calothrix sp. NIES-2100]|nr:hypothetical protein NIES2100_64470 [Calothrix sp. NIES-2100]
MKAGGSASLLPRGDAPRTAPLGDRGRGAGKQGSRGAGDLSQAEGAQYEVGAGSQISSIIHDILDKPARTKLPHP